MVDDGPLLEEDLILYNHFERIIHEYPNELAVISCHQPADLLNTKTQSRSNEPDCLRWTYAELWERAGILGKALLAHGVSTSTRLAVFLRNQAEWALAFWTALRLGVEFVPMHPKTIDSPVELKNQLGLGIVNPGAIIVADAETAERLEMLVPEDIAKVALKITAASSRPLSEQWRSLASMLEEGLTTVALPNPKRSAENVVSFYFTGGTTALPKPAPLTSGNAVLSICGYANRWHITPERRVVGHLPSFHMYGNFGWFTFLFCGGCVVFPAEAYSAAATLEAIEKEHCTDMPGTPAMVDSLITHPTAASRNLESLMHINLGGSVIHPKVFEKCRAPPLNATITTATFGLSEAKSQTTWDLHEQQPDYQDVVSVGKVIPGSKLRVCAPESRELVPWGTAGKIHLGNSYLYKGFLGRFEEDWLYTEGDVTWVKSGDQAYLGEQGEVYILGRYKDVFIRGGRILVLLLSKNVDPSSARFCSALLLRAFASQFCSSILTLNKFIPKYTAHRL